MSASAAETLSVADGPPSASERAAASERARVADLAQRQVLWGVVLGIVSAICYTATNIALRGVTRDGDADWALWVTAMKSLPSALSAWVLLGGRAVGGLSTLPPLRTILILMAVGFAVQGGGNVLFQWSLARCGLALSVPTVFATLMLTGAVLGRAWLGESVTIRSTIAMGLLIGAIGILSYGAEGAAAALPAGPSDFSPKFWVLSGIAFAAIAGVFYGVLGVVIRQTTRDSVPLPATLAIVSSTGVLGVGVPAVVRLGPEILQATSQEWGLMVLAGVLNAIAFFAIGGSLRRIPVVQVNLLNASQAAMCAIGGVLVYREPLTAALIGGTLLTIVGLTLMSRRSGGTRGIAPAVSQGSPRE
ncbi:MAG: DMT family transporter [Planctomycetota bacterium]|nr:DMT family transporter [Planctomycetaceae bacterium]MDQ3330167.1 DMT family transporter [Planctomycetota bacterium]